MWVIFSTSSLDGHIATRKGDSKLSCEHDLALLHSFRCWSDLVLVGANTAIIDDPSLLVKRVKCNRQPHRGVVDGRFKVPIHLRMFNDKPWLTVVVTTFYGIRRNPLKYKTLRSRGVKIVAVNEGPEVDMKKMRLMLNDMGFKNVLVEGGGKLNWSLIKSNVIDKIEITYVGRVLGAGVQVVQGDGYDEVADAPIFVPVSFQKCKCGRCVHVTWEKAT